MSVIERLNGSKINYKFSIIEIVLKNEHNVKNSSRLFFKCKRAKKSYANNTEYTKTRKGFFK